MSDLIESELCEEWKPISGHPGYEVSNLARVRSLDTMDWNGRVFWLRKGRILKQNKCNPYLRVQLGAGNYRLVHRLIASEFIPNPFNLPAVNHKNGIKRDNRIDNLEWISNQGNLLHARRVLKNGIGSSRSISKLTEKDIPIIRRMLAAGDGATSIGRKFGVSNGTIKQIRDHKTWLHW